jgi:hypothetical protein
MGHAHPSPRFSGAHPLGTTVEKERSADLRLADDGDATRHGPKDEARAHESRVDEKGVGAKPVEHGANEDFGRGQLAAVHAAVLLHEASGHDATERGDDVEP